MYFVGLLSRLLVPMICKTGCGSMAAIMRLLTVESCPEITTGISDVYGAIFFLGYSHVLSPES